MIITPRQLTHRAEFYHQLQQLTAAGIGLVPALEQLRRAPPAASYREPIQRVLTQLTRGYTLAESLQQGGATWLPAFDRSLIEAGEHSGRLDACFRMLSDYYTDRARIAGQLITTLLYPAFLLHLLVAVASLILYLWYPRLSLLPLGGLLLIYAMVAFVIYAGQSKRGESWRSLVETVVTPVPVLGTARRYLALARFAAALEALISAGVTIIEAWSLAATASASPALRREVAVWKPLLHAGQTPGEVIATSSVFPQLFINEYNTAELSGKLDETLRRLYGYYQEEGTRKLHAVSRWVPILIYLLILIAGGGFVIWFWVHYFSQVSQIMNGF
jgi:type IV pilus assembly protein PilC